MQKRRFEEIVNRFSETKVAVLGDFFLDLYIYLDRSLSEFSLETNKEAFQAKALKGQPGAAGVVANNLMSLGAQTAGISSIGKDGNGYTLSKALEEIGVDTGFLILSDERMTPTYTKPMMQELNGQCIELNRIDIFNRSPTPELVNRQLVENVNQALTYYDGILVVEQIKHDGVGTMSPFLRKALGEISQQNPEKIIMVDSRHFGSEYRNISLKLNLSEAIDAASIPEPHKEIYSQSDYLSIAESCLHKFYEVNQKPAFITLGKYGITGKDKDNTFYIPGFKINGPIDIVGAGDSVLAGIGLALCAGATPEEAAFIGNLVGSITVQQIGTTGTATKDDLMKRFDEYKQQKEQ